MKRADATAIATHTLLLVASCSSPAAPVSRSRAEPRERTASESSSTPQSDEPPGEESSPRVASDTERFAAEARTHIRTCYNRAPVEGGTMVQITVGPERRLAAVRVMQGDRENAPLAGCVERALQTTILPSVNEATTFTLPINVDAQ